MNTCCYIIVDTSFGTVGEPNYAINNVFQDIFPLFVSADLELKIYLVNSQVIEVTSPRNGDHDHFEPVPNTVFLLGGVLERVVEQINYCEHDSHIVFVLTGEGPVDVSLTNFYYEVLKEVAEFYIFAWDSKLSRKFLDLSEINAFIKRIINVVPSTEIEYADTFNIKY